MPRNGSGTFTLAAGNPVVTGTVIDSTWANATLEDIANEITNSLSRNGEGGMLAPFRVADGTVTAPGLAFTTETNTGLYRAGSGEIWLAVGGVAVAQITGNGLMIPSGKRISLPAPVNDADAANKEYVDDQVAPVIGYADFYLGSKASDPTTNNSGGALTQGTTYWSSTLQQMRVYNGSNWVPMPTISSLVGQTFSGDGSDTTFTLANPTGNAINLEVFISGVRQVPTTDYSVSGTTLTFVAAPPSGTNNIFVRYAQLATITDGAGSIVYTPAGAGAVATTVQSKLRDVVSRSDYDSDANYNTARNALTVRLDHVFRASVGTTDRLISEAFGDVVSILNYIPASEHAAIRSGTTTYDCYSAIQAAIDAIEPYGGTILFPRGKYITAGGHEIVSSRCVRLVGEGENATQITHTGNNVCFWFKGQSLIGCQGSGVFDLLCTGPSTGSSARFIRVSDAWGLGARRIVSYGYQQGVFAEVYNLNSWTENALFEDVMIRQALVGFTFTRSGSGTDTDSFYGFTASRVHMDLDGGNNRFISIPTQASLAKLVYGANIDRCIAWFGASGGGKRVVDVGNTNSLLGKCHLITDGTGGITDGSDLNLFYVADGGVIDLQGLVYTRQGTPGVSLSVPQIMKQQSTSGQNNRRPNVRIKGAQIQLNGTATAGQANHVGWSSGYCPPFSSFRVRISFSGWNTEGTSEWIVSNYNVNNYTNLTRIHGPGTATELVHVRALNGGTPGSYSANNGLRFEIYLASSTSANNIQWTADVEML